MRKQISLKEAIDRGLTVEGCITDLTDDYVIFTFSTGTFVHLGTWELESDYWYALDMTYNLFDKEDLVRLGICD